MVALAGFLEKRARVSPRRRWEPAGRAADAEGPAGNDWPHASCRDAPARAPCRRVSDRRCEELGRGPARIGPPPGAPGGHDGAMIDHLAIQCSDVTKSIAFYDAVLAPLGGSRVMDFGDGRRFRCRPEPGILGRPAVTGEGFRESHIAFHAADRAAVRVLLRRRRGAGGRGAARAPALARVPPWLLRRLRPRSRRQQRRGRLPPSRVEPASRKPSSAGDASPRREGQLRGRVRPGGSPGGVQTVSAGRGRADLGRKDSTGPRTTVSRHGDETRRRAQGASSLTAR